MSDRILRDKIVVSETLATLSAEAERLFFRLITQCDDFGRYFANPAIVKTRCFSLFPDERLGTPDIKLSTMDAWLTELATNKGDPKIVIYTVKGRRYLQVLHWDDYNKVRALKSKYPAPEEADECVVTLPVVAKCREIDTEREADEVYVAKDVLEDDLFADVPTPPQPPQQHRDVRAETAATLQRMAARLTPEDQAWASVCTGRDAELAHPLGEFCRLFGMTPPKDKKAKMTWVAGMRFLAGEVGVDDLPALLAEFAGRRNSGSNGYQFTITDPHSLKKMLPALRDRLRGGIASGESAETAGFVRGE